MVNQLGGRKAAACLVGLIVVVGCFLLKGTLPKELIDAVQYLVSTYLAGNIAADVVESVKAKVTKPDNTSSTVLHSLEKRQTELDGKLTELTGAVQVQDQTLKQVVQFLSTQPKQNS